MGYGFMWKKFKVNIVSMGAFVAWLWFFPLFGIVQSALEDAGGKLTFFNLAFLGATVLGYVAFLFLKGRPSVLRLLISAAAPASAAATWLAAFLSWLSPAGIFSSWGYHSLAMYVLLPALMGFGGAIYFAFWGTTIYHISPDKRGRYMAAMVAAATVFYTALVVVFNTAPLPALSLSGVFLLFPSLSTKTVAAFFEHGETGSLPPDSPPAQRDAGTRPVQPWKAFWLPFALTVFCFYILAWATHDIVFSVIKEESTFSPIFGQAIYALTFVFAACYLDREQEIEKMALLGLIVLGCSFLLLPVFLSTEVIWPIYYLLEASYGFIDLFMWVSLAVFCRLLTGDPKTYYAGGLLLNILFIMFGIIMMPLVAIKIEGEAYFILSITAGIILFLGVLPAFSLKKLRLSRQEQVVLSDIIHQEVGKLKVRQDLDLDIFTQKEKEILFLMLAGQANPAIAKKLAISKNTLKTHIRNIYRKALVRNRSELLFKLAEMKKNEPSP